jgi:hypothetical protein
MDSAEDALYQLGQVALVMAALGVPLAMWGVGIGAAIFTARRTHRSFMRLQFAEWASRSIAGVVAVVVCVSVVVSLALLALLLLNLIRPVE